MEISNNNSTNTTSNKCTPYDLIETALGYPGKGLGNLLNLLREANKEEVEWLEFKAVTIPGDSERRKQDGNLPADNYHWSNMVRPVMALANHMGGAVIIGIEDELKHIVGLDQSEGWIDSGRNADEFLRRLMSVFDPNAEFRMQVRGNKSQERFRLLQSIPENSRILKIDTIDGKPVLVIVVRPVPVGESLLGVEDLQREVEIYPVRIPGDQGRIKDVKKASEKSSIENSRVLERSDLSALRDQIRNLCDGQKERAVSDGRSLALEDAIAHYKSRVERQFADYARAIPLTLRQEHSNRIGTESLDSWTESTFPSSNQSPAPGGADFSTIEEALKTSRRFALLGDPGSGKSWVLRHHVLKRMVDYRPGGKVAVYVPLRNYKPSQTADDYFMGLSPLLERSTESLARKQLLDLASDGRLEIYFDGLGECTESNRENLIRCINDLLDSRHFPTVIGCRQLDFSHDDFDGRINTFMIRPLDTSQQKTLVQSWLGSQYGDAEEFIANVEKLEGGHSLLVNPLTLRLLCDLSRRGETLTTNRAKLWEAFLNHWYLREFREGKSGGTQSLGWEQIREALGLIAVAAKRNGNAVEIPLLQAKSVVEPLLTADAQNDLFHAVESGGLLFSVSQDQEPSFIFEDAVFRDYLAAAYLLTHPELLQKLDAGTRLLDWELTLAFACELGATSNTEFIRLAWAIDPLLVAAAAPTGTFVDQVVFPENPWVAGVVSAILNLDSGGYAKRINEGRYWQPPGDLLARLKSTSFWQSFSKTEEAKERLARFKQLLVSQAEPWADLLDASFEGLGEREWRSERETYPVLFAACGLGDATSFDASPIDLRLIARGVLIPSNYQPYFVDCSEGLNRFFQDPNGIDDRQWHLIIDAIKTNQLLCNVSSELILGAAFNLLTVGSLIEDAVSLCNETNVQLAFDSDERKELAEECQEAEAAVQLVQRKILSATDFAADKLSAWLEHATPQLAAGMLQCGLIGKESIPADRLDDWIQDADVETLAIFAETGVRRKEQMREHIVSRISGATQEVAERLISNGIVTAQDIPDDLKWQWISDRPASHLVRLVVGNLISKEDLSSGSFPSVRQRLANEATTTEAIELLKTGSLMKEDFKERFDAWLATASAIDAVKLVKASVVARKDFQPRTSDFVRQIESSENPVELACALADSGLVVRSDITKELLLRFRREARAAEAMRLINAKLIDGNEFFSTTRASWIQEAKDNPQTAASLVLKELLQAEEFEGFTQDWLKRANGGTIAHVVSAGLIKTSDISASHKVAWLNAMNPAHVLALLKCGALVPSDLSEEHKTSLLQRLAGSQLAEARKLFPDVSQTSESVPKVLRPDHQQKQSRTNAREKIEKIADSKGANKPHSPNVLGKMHGEITRLLNGTFGPSLSRSKLIEWLNLCDQSFPKDFYEICKRKILTLNEISVENGYDTGAVQNFERIHLFDAVTGEKQFHVLYRALLAEDESREKVKALMLKKRLTCLVQDFKAPNRGHAKHAIFGPNSSISLFSKNVSSIAAGDVVVCELAVSTNQDGWHFYQLRVSKHYPISAVKEFRDQAIASNRSISLTPAGAAANNQTVPVVDSSIANQRKEPSISGSKNQTSSLPQIDSDSENQKSGFLGSLFKRLIGK